MGANIIYKALTTGKHGSGLRCGAHGGRSARLPAGTRHAFGIKQHGKRDLAAARRQ